MQLRIVLMFLLAGAIPFAVVPLARRLEGEPVLVLHATPEVQLEEQTPGFGDQVRSALKEGRYADLDAMAQSFRSPDARFRSGIPKLFSFYAQVVDYAYGPEIDQTACKTAIPSSFEAVSTRLADWQKAEPRSLTMQIAYARLWEQYASDARRCGKYYDESEGSWDLIHTRLAEAERMLIAADLTTDPAAADELIQLGALRHFDRAEFDSLYHHAVATFPWYYPLYATRAYFLQQTWFGRPGEEKAFLEELRSKERGDEGQIAYSFAAAQMVHNGDWTQLFDGTGLEIHAVIAAYQVREQRYGLNNSDWNVLFLLTTHSLYCVPANQALLQIGDHWDPSVWSEKKYFDESVAFFHAHSPY